MVGLYDGNSSVCNIIGELENDIKDKEKSTGQHRRSTIMIKSNPISTGWATHKLENNYITVLAQQF